MSPSQLPQIYRLPGYTGKIGPGQQEIGGGHSLSVESDGDDDDDHRYIDTLVEGLSLLSTDD